MNNKFKFFNKKASMQLSINMIVILIMAVVVLGLGLGFINGMFAKMGDSFESKAGDEPSPTVASVSNPITVSRSNVLARPGDTEIIKVSVFNTGAGGFANEVANISCLPNEPTKVYVPGSIHVTSTQNVAKEFMLPIVIDKIATAKTYVCAVSVGSLSTDVAVEVKV